jgi:hypothetical protein
MHNIHIYMAGYWKIVLRHTGHTICMDQQMILIKQMVSKLGPRT